MVSIIQGGVIMGFFDWLEQGIPNLRWYDISLVKLAVASGVLFIMALLPEAADFLLGISWYWYLGLMVLASILPVKKMFE